MFCNKCGKEIGAEPICPNCGENCAAALQQVANAVPAAVRRPPGIAVFPVFTLILCLAGVLMGILFVAGVFADIPTFGGSFGEYAAFGGDFYTEIHAQTQKIADNTAYNVRTTRAMASLVEKGVGIFLMLFSLLKLAGAVEGYCRDRKLAGFMMYQDSENIEVISYEEKGNAGRF